MAKGVLAILGSGETAPGMTKVHRELLSRLDEVRAVNLDTPYGFQLNVPQMTEKLVDYFKVSLQTDLKPLSFTNYEESSGVEKELFRQSVRDSTYVFAGPGSPSYALNQWKGLHLEEVLFEVLEKGGSVCFSSAAALTLGAFTAPVYEIYKAGSPLYWLEGLNLMGLIGLNCVVIPHFNNNEGESYDTSCCYLGLKRLEMLEMLLPEGAVTLGIDEHTALKIDLETHIISVTGKGSAYLRHNGKTQVINSGMTALFHDLNIVFDSNSMVNEVKAKNRIYSPLDLAKIIEAGGDQASDALTELVSIAISADEKHPDINLLIDSIIDFRNNIKSSGNYPLADEIREILLRANIKIQDSPSGTSWSIQGR